LTDRQALALALLALGDLAAHDPDPQGSELDAARQRVKALLDVLHEPDTREPLSLRGSNAAMLHPLPAPRLR
jgi:hypothetical protein